MNKKQMMYQSIVKGKDRFKYKEVEVKTDCVSYMPEKDESHPCDALTELVCENELCAFYKAYKK